MAGCQEDATSGFPYPDNVTSGRRAHDAILTDQELLDAIGSTDLGNGLGDLRVPVPSITANHEE